MTLIAVITSGQLLLRLALAVLAGVVVGYERESHGRAAGLRTTMLTCVAAALAMILSTSVYEGAVVLNWRPDPTRIAAGVLTGIGFLGAGAIVKEGRAVRGVTTAAVLWFVTIIGLSFGAGQMTLGLAGLAVALAALFVLPSVESGIQNDWYGAVSVTLALDGMPDDEVRRLVESAGVTVKKMDYDLDLEARRKTVRCEIKFKAGDTIEVTRRVLSGLAPGRGVIRVTLS